MRGLGDRSGGRPAPAGLAGAGGQVQVQAGRDDPADEPGDVRPAKCVDQHPVVIRLAGEGQSASDIAAQLNLSHGTVRNYLSEAIGKLGVANRIEAYRLARQKGWL